MTFGGVYVSYSVNKKEEMSESIRKTANISDVRGESPNARSIRGVIYPLFALFFLIY